MTWLDDTWREALAPEPALKVSEWADRHRILPPTSAEPGSWRTDRVPYLAEIMDALSTGSPFERVVLMKSAQAGGTEVGLNWLAYLVCHAPGLALLVQPSLDMARRNTRTRIDPMIESTPALRERISEPRSRDAYNSAFTKSFPGGMLVMTGANSAAALRSTPCRYLMLDEVDGYPADVDSEGDPVALAVARTVTFRGRRRIFLVSTPTVCGVSRIEKAYLEGAQRRFEVACVHCGSLAPIGWKNIRWPEGRREQAHLVCEACNGVMQELDKPRLLAGGSWRATADGDGRTATFHISALYSPFVTWAEIAIGAPRAVIRRACRLGKTCRSANPTKTLPLSRSILARLLLVSKTIPPPRRRCWSSSPGSTRKTTELKSRFSASASARKRGRSIIVCWSAIRAARRCGPKWTISCCTTAPALAR
jgi:phage terminase large subunit GpA-like protein